MVVDAAALDAACLAAFDFAGAVALRRHNRCASGAAAADVAVFEKVALGAAVSLAADADFELSTACRVGSCNLFVDFAAAELYAFRFEVAVSVNPA